MSSRLDEGSSNADGVVYERRRTRRNRTANPRTETASTTSNPRPAMRTERSAVSLETAARQACKRSSDELGGGRGIPGENPALLGLGDGQPARHGDDCERQAECCHENVEPAWCELVEHPERRRQYDEGI
jgi:hypothetical protein